MSSFDSQPSRLQQTRLAFIGGGNMASAIIGGLLRQGVPPSQILVVEPFEAARTKLSEQFGIHAHAQANTHLHIAQLVVWAIKPQTFKEAAAQAAPHCTQALHLSVAAGIRSSSIASWLESERIVRAMPNTPALVGQGISGLYARAGVGQGDQSLIEQVLAPTGQVLWVGAEEQLDTVTALSGSGPAYVFYFLEAMVQAGVQLGLPEADARRLAVATFAGAAELARQSADPLELLRERVTSKRGTTYAALTHMQATHIKTHFIAAMQAAHQRAVELGDEFGK